MSGISSGIGILSGINTAQLIDQLINLDAAPRRLLETRVRRLDVQRTAFLELSAKILNIKNAGSRFDELDFFRRLGATSTNETALRATADSTAVPGSHAFRVHSLVTNHALISRGFANANIEPVGAGEVTIEVGNGRVNRATDLSTLNGGLGVRRGVFTITDRSGATAEIDLSTAVTVDDVLDAINNNSAIDVRASVTGLASGTGVGDRIVLEDVSGGTGNLVVADRTGGFTALDLGLTVNAAISRIDGRDLVRLTDATPLSLLNDGNGVDRLLNGVDLQFDSSFGVFGVKLTDFLDLDTSLAALNSGQGVRLGTVRISDRSGQSAEIDLSAARTVGDVRDALNAAGLNISVAIVNSHFQITDTTEELTAEPPNLKIEDVTGFAAADLGIASEGEDDESAVFGRDIYRVATVGDLIRAINHAPGNNDFVRASISDDGNGLTFDALGFPNSVTVSAGAGSSTASDLGLDGATFTFGNSFATRPLIAGLNTVLLSSLRGGQGVTPGTVRFTDRAGQTSAIDLSAAKTLRDVVDLINNDATISIRASVNDAGNGLVLRDESGAPSGSIGVQDVAGSLAADLGIATAANGQDGGTEVNGGDLDLRYISRRTLLSSLNGGRGISLGQIRITDSSGAVFDVDLPASLTTVGEVLDAISSQAPSSIRASVNATGDGILVEDASGGALPLTIEDVGGGRTAADLRLRQAAGAGENFIDGAFEYRVRLEAGDTLTDLARKLNELGGEFSATVLNDQSQSNPFRLALSSTSPGRAGELVVDASIANLGLSTLTQARDAIVTLGQGDAAAALLVSSRSNTLTGVLPGVTLDLLAPSQTPITVTIAQDVDAIVEDLQEFVDAYNELQATIDEDIQFTQETNERGPLLGEPTVNVIRNRLHSVVQNEFEGAGGSLKFLTTLGVRLGPNNSLQFDEERFRETYEASPAEVERLFTAADAGFGDRLESTVDDLTREFDGVLARQDQLLLDQQELLNDRIASLNVLLDAKRGRLEAQFVALERTLAILQDQQNSLASIIQSTGTGTTVR